MRTRRPRLSPADARASWQQAQATSPSVAAAEFRCELVTPMCGGGIKAGEVDSQLPVRPSALRGQLRFWWRLLYASAQTPNQLFAAEIAIWGGITQAGPVASLVRLRVKSTPIKPDGLRAKSAVSGLLAYALILEPGADIRRLSHRHAPAHASTHPVQDAYPRAAFGLPIVFHFKDHGGGDPTDHVLEPAASDRMASPLILRPYFDGQRYRPAALLLPTWEERLSVDMRFRSGPSRPAWPTDPAARAQLADQIGPMQGRGVDDALSAFLDFFATGGC